MNSSRRTLTGNASCLVRVGGLDLDCWPDGKPGPLETAHLGTSDPARPRAPGSQSAHQSVQPPTVEGGKDGEIKGGQGDFLTVIERRQRWKHHRLPSAFFASSSPRFNKDTNPVPELALGVLGPPDPIRNPRAEVPPGRGIGRLVGQALGRRGDHRCVRPAPLRLCGCGIGRCFCAAPTVRRSPCRCRRGETPAAYQPGVRFVIDCKISKRPPHPAPGRVNISADQCDGPKISKGGHPSARFGSQR